MAKIWKIRRPAQRGVNAEPCRALSAIGVHLKSDLKVDRALRARYSLVAAALGLLLLGAGSTAAAPAKGLLASTFLGGTGDELIATVAVAPGGDVYVAGWTVSPDFAPQGYGAKSDGKTAKAFIARLDGGLKKRLASAVLGGNGETRALAMALDAKSGDVVLAGWTRASDFPATPGAFHEKNAGGYDIFVARLDADLKKLQAATLLGGRKHDRGRGLALGADGSVYVVGSSSSPDYPVSAAAYGRNFNGGLNDIVVSRLDGELRQLQASTFIGGGGEYWQADNGSAVALGADGSVYIAGWTDTTNYPVTPGAYRHRGILGPGVVLSKFDRDLDKLAASTVIGTYGESQARALALGRQGEVYIAGCTWAFNYPGPFNSIVFEHRAAGPRIMISKLKDDLSGLARSVMLGATAGSDRAGAAALALDAAGRIYVAGRAGELFWATGGVWSPAYAGGDSDAFVSLLDADLNVLQSGFLGGSGGDEALGMALAADGSVYVAGRTTSTNYPVTEGAAGATPAGATDGFVSRLPAGLASVTAAELMSPCDREAPEKYRWPDTVLVANFDTAYRLDTSKAGGNNWSPGTCVHQQGDNGGWYLLKGGANDYISIPDRESLHTPRLTVSCWFRVGKFPGKSRPAIVSKDRKGSPRDWYLFLEGSNKQWVVGWECAVQKDASSEPEEVSLGGAVVAPDTWHHAAATYDGKVLRLYLDGSLAGTLEKPGLLAVTTNPINIGHWVAGGPEQWRFKGALDNIRIYNTALSEAEVQTLFKAGR